MKIRFAVLCLFILGATSSYAQTAEEIIAKSLQAIGGADKWAAFQSTKSTAVMAMQGMEFPATIVNAKPNKMRVEVSVMGQNIIQAYDGSTAWMVNPLQGGADAQVMPEEAAENFKNQEFENALLNYASKGHKAETDGQEVVEGTNCHKIKLTKKDGTVEYHLIDAETFAPIMMRTAIKSGPAAGQFVETFMSDYQEVDGVMVPFFIEAKMAGQSMQKITVKEMKFNVAVEDSFFAFPKK